MKPWQFRQRTPGFGISRGYYLSVLSGSAVLPTLEEVVHPKSEAGAVEGLGAPLGSGASKDDLHRPLARGAYALTTKDRKTVIKLLVLPKEEANYDPEPLLRSPMAADLSPEVLARISATWSLLQLTFETHHPMVYDAVRFMLQLSKRLADLSAGVVADPISQAYKLPLDVFFEPQSDPRIDARDYVKVHRRENASGRSIYTLGLQKFALPELEIPEVSESMDVAAASFLYSLSQKVLLGQLVGPGDAVGSKELPLVAAQGGLDRGQWEGIPVVDLLPGKGKSPDEALASWLSEPR